MLNLLRGDRMLSLITIQKDSLGENVAQRGISDTELCLNYDIASLFGEVRIEAKVFFKISLTSEVFKRKKFLILPKMQKITIIYIQIPSTT